MQSNSPGWHMCACENAPCHQRKPRLWGPQIRPRRVCTRSGGGTRLTPRPTPPCCASSSRCPCAAQTAPTLSAPGASGAAWREAAPWSALAGARCGPPAMHVLPCSSASCRLALLASGHMDPLHSALLSGVTRGVMAWLRNLEIECAPEQLHLAAQRGEPPSSASFVWQPQGRLHRDQL